MLTQLFFVVLATLLALTSGQGLNTAANQANDVLILQYALTLERLESYFYNTGLSQSTLSQAAFTAAGYNASVYAQLNIVAMEEAAHVTLLSGALGSASVPACTYNFTAAFASPAVFIATAAVLETTGTSAYDGAISGISNAAYASVAATISTVEARHTSYLNLLAGINPVPYVLQPTLNSSSVVAAILPFLAGGSPSACPYNVASVLGITVRPGGVTLLANGSVGYTGPAVAGATYTAAQQTNDLNVLQYALVLENLEAAFYNTFIANYPLSAWTAAGYSALTYTYIQNITAQENAHVAAISATITARGGTPIQACTAYNFSTLTTVYAYLQTAFLLENTGVTAYDGAASFITDTALESIAATIVAVEGRHTALIAILLNQTAGSPSTIGGFSVQPFPTVLDYAATPAMVIANVTALRILGTCPQVSALVLPMQLAVTSVLGDPAFVGFNGQSFQVHGIPSRNFNILSTRDIQFNAKFQMIEEGESMTAGQMKQARLMREIKSALSTTVYSLPLTTAFSHSGTFLSQMGLKLGSSARIFAEAGAYTSGFKTVTLNGKALAVSTTAVKVGEGYFITHPTPSTIIVDTPTVSFTLVNADGFFNIEQATLNVAHTSDLLIDGLLGQTVDSEWKVLNTKEFKTHMVMDYLVGDEDIFSDDFVSTVYHADSQ